MIHNDNVGINIFKTKTDVSLDEKVNLKWFGCRLKNEKRK